MRRITVGLLGASIAFGSGLWLACGGSDGANEMLTQPDPEAGAVLPEAGTSDTSTANDAATGADTGGGQQEAGGGDGGINPPDAGPGGTTGVITCGSTSCAIPAQTCCVERISNSMTSYGCATTCPGLDAGGGGGDVTALKCSGQANCAAGTVCCVRQLNNNGAASECKASCDVNNEAQLCDLAAAVSGCTGAACSNNQIRDWNLPPTYATCGGKGN